MSHDWCTDMTMMMGNGTTLRAASLLLLASVLWSYAAANTEEAVDCCLLTSNNKVPFKIVKTFRMQTVEGGCRIPATLFITKKGRRLCAPLPSGNNWVHKLLKRLRKKEKQQKRPKPSKGLNAGGKA